MNLRPHISLEEATCRCGCGAMPTEGFMDIVELLIESCDFSIPISNMIRCKKYNKKVGGVEDSPHLETSKNYGAVDLKCRDPKKRMIIITRLIFLNEITQIEIADKHIHAANIPEEHRLYGLLNWGVSK